MKKKKPQKKEKKKQEWRQGSSQSLIRICKMQLYDSEMNLASITGH